MMYHSTITFILDTICPWTHIARLRLKKALVQVRSELIANKPTDQEPPVVFGLEYASYQLFPEASLEGNEKRKYYLENKYSGSEEQLQKYEALMLAYFLAEDEPSMAENNPQNETEAAKTKDVVPFRLSGTMANTLPAHRLLRYIQSQCGPEQTDLFISALYNAYFAQGAHPSSHETLLAAARVTELPQSRVEAFLTLQERDEDSVHDICYTWDATRAAIRENAADGIDAVPWVVIEGRRRDFTLVGCKTVEEYVKALRSVIKESS